MKKAFFITILIYFGFLANIFSQTVIFSENFEGATLPALPTGWTEAHTGGGNGWFTNNGIVRWNSNNIVPHTNYAMVNDAQHFWNNPAKLTSPTFSLLGLSNPHLSFDYFFNGMNACYSCPIEQAWIEISTDGGTTFNLLDSIYEGWWYSKFEDLSTITPTANCQLRFCYADPGVSTGKGINGIAIDNICVYEPAAYDLGISALSPVPGNVQTFVKVGDSVYFSGSLNNYGMDTTGTYSISYQVGTSAPVTSTYYVGVSPYSQTVFNISTPYQPTTPGPQAVKVWVHFAGDTNHANDTMTTIITGIAAPNMPKKRFFIEEITGTWCGECPRGIIYLDSMWKNDSNIVSIASVHDNDAMASDNVITKSYDSFTLSKDALGYPSDMIDRRSKDYVEYADKDIHDPTNKNMFGYANISVSHTIAGNTLTANVTVQPAIDITGDYQLELVVVEQDVTGTTPGYAQNNAYYISPGPSGTGCGYNFNDSTSPIQAGHLEFPFVARWTIPNDLNIEPNGVAGSLPDTLLTGILYNYSFTPITIPSNWVPSKLSCIALLIDNNQQSANYGDVLNCAANTHSPNHLQQVRTTDEQLNPIVADVFPNPANDKVNVFFYLNQTETIELAVYDIVGRKVYSLPAQQMNAGKEVFNISTTNFSPGIYSIIISTEKGKITKLLSVMK